MPIADDTLDRLMSRFYHACHAKAVIVGPHGTGKSTLLCHLVPLLGSVRYKQLAGQPPETDLTISAQVPGVVWLGLRRETHPVWQSVVASRPYWHASDILVLDGLEQLRYWERCLLGLVVRAHRMGVLGTCHRPLRPGWTTLHSTAGNAHVVPDLVARLIRAHRHVPLEWRDQLQQPRRLEELINQEQGNVREVLMRLYDRYEQLVAQSSRSAD